MLDRYFVKSIHGRDAKMLSVEQENDAKRRRIDKDCHDSNQHYDRVKDGMR